MQTHNDSTGTVAQDMQRIFAPTGLASDGHQPPLPVRSARPATRRSTRTGARRGIRFLTFGVPVIALGSAALLFSQVPARAPVVPASTREAPSRPSIQAAAFSASAPLATRPADDEPVDDLDAIVPADIGDEQAPAPLPVALVRNGPPTPRSRSAGPSSKVAAVRPDGADRRTGDGCAPGSTDDACIYRDVRAADRRLVAAYENAVAAGVARRELVAVRRAWDRALAISLDDPDETIRRYDALSDELRGATRDRRLTDTVASR